MAAAAMSAVSCAYAQSAESIGEIEVHLDGKDMIFHSLKIEQDGEVSGTSGFYVEDAPEAPGGKETKLTISGWSNADMTGGVVAIHLTYLDAANAPHGIAVSERPIVALHPDDPTPPYWVSVDVDGKVPAIAFSKFEVNADGGFAAGEFAAELCRQDEPEDDVHLDDCKTITGSFSTKLIRNE